MGAVGSKLGVGSKAQPQIAQCSELGEREESVNQWALPALELGDCGEGSQVLGVVGAQGPAGGWEVWSKSAAVGLLGVQECEGSHHPPLCQPLEFPL